MLIALILELKLSSNRQLHLACPSSFLRTYVLETIRLLVFLLLSTEEDNRTLMAYVGVHWDTLGDFGFLKPT